MNLGMDVYDKHTLAKPRSRGDEPPDGTWADWADLKTPLTRG